MIDRLLIANRGEIACRIIRTARKLGIETVAVYSDADAQALHVEHADKAVRLGPAPAADSYLRGDLIIDAALRTGASAIHPGYGFLSENADFAQAVADAGLVFVGPSPDAIRAMGLKGAAKAIMEQAGVPVVPGYHGEDQDPEKLTQEAGRIGFPVLIKAVAGGGGKGMRRVDDIGDFAAALFAAQREAEAAFGNPGVIVEKFIAKPRHIEVQIFGDQDRVLHLYERDCSLQRRHQKVIEEAPAPGITDQMRDAMTQAAVRAGEAINYRGAGTVEFIADASEGLHPDKFWFMEMNTRLQVEHPVTEAITGIDLVEWQLRVAAGQSLGVTQDQIQIEGHAFEARLYAEDPAAGFLPATGVVQALEFPPELRADSGIRSGDDITPFYDPMIAKLVAHGPNRSDAMTDLRKGLDATRIAGTTTNIDFLAALLADADVRRGQVDTGLIERKSTALCARPNPEPGVVALAAALMNAGETPHAGFALWSPSRRRTPLEFGDKAATVDVTTLGPSTFAVQLGEETHHVVLQGQSATVDGITAPVWYHASSRQLTLSYQGRWTFTLPDPLARGTGPDVGGDVVLAPMPGNVTALTVASGDWVRSGDPLGAMEAMKMELTLRAPRDGQIASVAVAQGAQVEAGAVLIRLEPEDG